MSILGQFCPGAYVGSVGWFMLFFFNHIIKAWGGSLLEQNTLARNKIPRTVTSDVQIFPCTKISSD